MAQQLQEYVDSRGVSMSVDREQGLLRGVKLIGLQSRNGRRYRESALTEAAALYEEAKVNVNHPKGNPLSPRDYQDRLGVIRNVRLWAGEGLFGDLHFNPKHALAEQLVWDAEHNPRNVGFSHNVLAKLTREGESVVVEEITKVQSVDLVADPAATEGLFEQLSEPIHWEALTTEMLQIERPDLVEEIRLAEMQSLKQQIAEAKSAVETATKRQRIAELLCRYQLSIDESEASAERKHLVSTAFLEMLEATCSEAQLEALIAERAALMQVNERTSQLQRPRSREQHSLLLSDRAELISAQDFATLLKSGCN